MEEDNHVIYSYVQDPNDGQQVVYEEDQLQVVQDQVLVSYTHTCIFPKKFMKYQLLQFSGKPQQN